MSRLLSFALLAALLPPTWCAAQGVSTSPMNAAKLTYPAARRGEQIDDYHGKMIADPYRWLEDPDSEETRAWVAAQNEVTFAWLAQIPARDKIKARLTELWNYERFGLPSKRGGHYFYTRNDGLQNQSVLYVADSLTGPPRLLLDPNTLSADGTVSLAGTSVSEDGNYLAYGLASAGSDWVEWKVRDIATGADREDHLKWVKFSGVSWTKDNRGFFYSRYDAPPPGEKYTGANFYQKLFYHRLGEPQEQDTLIYERKDQKEWGFGGRVSEDGQYLIIHVWRGSEQKNQIFYRKLTGPDAPVVELITGFDGDYDYLGNDGERFWFVTDLDAPLKRVIGIDLARPEREQWQTLIPEGEQVITGADVVGGRFILEYLQDACSAVSVFEPSGKLVRQVELPGLGTASGFGGRQDNSETFYAFTNYTTPGSIYRYDVKTGETSLWKEPKVAFDRTQFESKQVFYQSKDGTRVPLIIVHKKGLKLDGNNPTILYGYGGFNVSLTPGFSLSNIVWLEMGGVFAVPNLRGGGEYGRAWHEGGMRRNKQNVFDDFIAAAEYLIAQKYTRPAKLAIRGGSNGGLLVGAAMTQRPELFGAAIPAVGVMDMLRYHKFTIGWAWAPEFGAADDEKLFPTLLAYSPLHNLKPGTKYPATMVTTADHDDRVVPAHSFKFAAALQHAHAGDTPALIRIETKSGHGAGTPTSKLIEAAADGYAFLVRALGMQPELPGK